MLLFRLLYDVCRGLTILGLMDGGLVASVLNAYDVDTSFLCSCKKAKLKKKRPWRFVFLYENVCSLKSILCDSVLSR